MTVARHQIDVVKAQHEADDIAGERERMTSRIHRSVKALQYLQADAIREAAWRTVVDPTASRGDTWEAVGLAMQASTAVFVASGETTGEVTFRVLDVDYTIPATGPTQDAVVSLWSRAMSLAMICRERPRVDVLARTSIDALRQRTGETDEFQYDWVEALQAYWRSEEGLIDTLLRAMRGADPESDTVAGAEMVAHVLYPPMELFYLLTQREDEKFNESLTKALELHKRYWTASAERTTDSHGFVAWRVLAIACLAKDAGVDITVESDYLPKNLLDGTWVGEKQL
ncbi:immunity 49 family protein [Lentzea albidocapillata]|uniref:immunity 49 family protein n=1 Tax=Lentzea albidocapillata TaxID=40571 RepID=UPI0011831A87|nr:immunity 49 family protein [Lentzea albidocapillata]